MPVMPPVSSADWDYAPLRITADTDRASAAALLAMQAESGGWELARVLRYADGTRRVWLRRRSWHRDLPIPAL